MIYITEYPNGKCWIHMCYDPQVDFDININSTVYVRHKVTWNVQRNIADQVLRIENSLSQEVQEYVNDSELDVFIPRC